MMLHLNMVKQIEACKTAKQVLDLLNENKIEWRGGWMMYSQEWFQIKLAKIRDMMHNDLQYAKNEVEMDAILKEVAVHLNDVKRAVYEVSDLFTDDEISKLVVDRLLESEYQRWMFFRRYGIMSESVCKCKQMSADV